MLVVTPALGEVDRSKEDRHATLPAVRWGCSVCTNLAHAIEREMGGKLTARSLRDPEVQQWLNRAKPGWQWEPTLLEVHGEVIRAYTGLRMRARLAVVLGPRKGLRVAQLVQQVLLPKADVNQGRRTFLQRGAMLAGGAFFARLDALQSINLSLADGKTKVQAKELKGRARDNALEAMRGDSFAKLLWRHLEARRFMVKMDQVRGSAIVVKDDRERHSGFVMDVLFVAQDGRIARQLHITDGNTTTNAVGIFYFVRERVEKVEILEVVDGQIAHTQTVVPSSTAGLTQQSVTTYQSSSECSICRNIYDFIFTAGCGLSGFFLCIAACAPLGPGAIACPIICAVVYAVVCDRFGGATIDEACAPYC